MIITSKDTGCILVPCATIPNTYVTIVPGTSEIDDAQWADARATAQHFLDDETLHEEFYKVNYEDILVKNTFHPDTLRNWYDTEERQDVRLEIFKQKEGVENGTIKG